MMYPLVLDFAADGVPVTVTCRVLGFSTQSLYKWRRTPLTQRDWYDAHLTNAAHDIHTDDPAFGFRFIADELHGRGIITGENRVARLCSQERIWSIFAKKRGLNRRSGPPVHDDLVDRQFSARVADQVWLTEFTEHRTAEGKLYLCAIKDVYSNRILGYSMNLRMKSSLAVAALDRVVAMHSPSATIVHSDRAANFGHKNSSRHCHTTDSTARWAASAPAETTPPWSHFSLCGNATLSTDDAGRPEPSNAWRSRPGSSGSTTDVASNAPSASSPR